MATAAIDSYKLLTALKATRKDANYWAEEQRRCSLSLTAPHEPH